MTANTLALQPFSPHMKKPPLGMRDAEQRLLFMWSAVESLVAEVYVEDGRDKEQQLEDEHRLALGRGAVVIHDCCKNVLFHDDFLSFVCPDMRVQILMMTCGAVLIDGCVCV